MHVHVTVGNIVNAEKTVWVNIVYPSNAMIVFQVFRYDAYSMALRGLYDVVLPS